MIREASISDYIAMDKVFRASARTFCSRSYNNQVIESWTGTPSPDRFHKNNESGDEQYVFTIADKVVCFGSINLKRHTLVSLFVSPEQSGKGIGQSMLEFLVARAVSSEIPVLKIDSSLNAANFYKRHGFIETGQSIYKTQNGVSIESVQMERKLFL